MTRRPHERTVGWREDRDAWELAMLDAAAAAGLPVLGICRGMQVMAVHARRLAGPARARDRRPRGALAGRCRVRRSIDVDVVPGTLLGRAVGDKGSVHCHHHQSVREHPGFVASAHAADGVLEAMEDPSRPFWLAVQWHPERIEDAGLFRALVEAARRSASSAPS